MRTFLSYLFISFLLQSCATQYQLKDGTQISKKELVKKIKLVKNKLEKTGYYHDKIITIRKNTRENIEENQPFYDEVNDLKAEKLSEASKLGKRTVFYQKINNGYNVYYQVDQINIFKPNDINLSLYMKEVNRIVSLLEKSIIKMDNIKDELNPDYGIGQQYFGVSNWTKENAFLPEVIELLVKGKKNKVFATKIAEYPNTSYLSLIQNIGEMKKVETLNYYTITIH